MSEAPAAKSIAIPPGSGTVSTIWADRLPGRVRVDPGWILLIWISAKKSKNVLAGMVIGTVLVKENVFGFVMKNVPVDETLVVFSSTTAKMLPCALTGALAFEDAIPSNTTRKLPVSSDKAFKWETSMPKKP